ncbi:MAG: sel1 repeat family protein [Deltaproteobacteria bacterium]|jgi:TPR repeat protein|nr:sel1 repeat family protein [Deltaproteobacteria bacterium]
MAKIGRYGDKNAMNRLSGAYYGGEVVPMSRAKAVTWWRMAVTRGRAGAMRDLGHAYYDGEGVEVDYDKAFKLFKRSSANGHKPALPPLGILYYHGHGVPMDKEIAFKTFQKAIGCGDAAINYWLGLSYAKGEGVTQDIERGIEFLSKAAEDKYGEAHYQLGLIFNRPGERYDRTRALNHWRPGSLLRHVESMNVFAKAWRVGDGLPQNVEGATMIWLSAANMGAPEACSPWALPTTIIPILLSTRGWLKNGGGKARRLVMKKPL